MKVKRSLKFILSSALLLGSISLAAVGCAPKGDKPGEQQGEDQPGKDEPITPDPGKDNPVTPEVKEPLVVLTGARNGYVGESFTLSAQVFNSEKTTIEWSSSNPSVLVVNSEGLVTLVGNGNATVTAKVSGTELQSTPVSITVFGSTESVRRLEIVSLPSKVGYINGEKLSFDGLKVMGYTYFGGAKNPNTGVDFAIEDLTLSMEEGMTLSTNGTFNVAITVEGYEAVSFEITVADKLVEKLATITTQPVLVYYLEDGQAKTNFSSLGVSSITYENGVRKGVKKLNATEYLLTIPNGTTLYEEGTYEVTIMPIDKTIKPVSFNIQVYTRDTTLRDLIESLATAKNYQYEIMNNVGTTTDTTGFHYLRTVTEKYYDEVDYQNVADGQGNISFNTDKIKSHTGYTDYTDDEGKTGIMEYKESGARIVSSSVVCEGPTSWWDKQTTLAKTFSAFTLGNLPTYTLNGKYLVVSVEQVPGDNDDGDLTLKNYPLIDEFLGFVGWSGSLITIMTRFTMEVNKDTGLLSMKAYFGDYGYTEMKVTAIGNARVAKVERAIQQGLKPNKVAEDRVLALREKLYLNNYTSNTYGSGGIGAAKTYQTENYYYDIENNSGYAKVKDKFYQFTSSQVGGVQTFALGDEIVTEAATIPEYVNSLKRNKVGYVGEYMKPVFGVGEDIGKLFTMGEYSNFSHGNQVCYQSFDTSIINSLSNFLTGANVTDDTLRFWAMVDYADAERVENVTINSIEFWTISVTTLSGNIFAITDVGSTHVDWIENGITKAENSL